MAVICSNKAQVRKWHKRGIQSTFRVEYEKRGPRIAVLSEWPSRGLRAAPGMADWIVLNERLMESIGQLYSVDGGLQIVRKIIERCAVLLKQARDFPCMNGFSVLRPSF